MKKRILSTLLVLCLCLTLLPTAALAEYFDSNDTSKFANTLADISRVSDNFYWSSSEPVSAETDSVEKTCTLDLDGKTLNIATLTIQDGVNFTVKNGTFTVATLKFAGAGSLVLESGVTASIADVTLSDGYVYKTGEDSYSATCPAITAPTTVTVVACPHPSTTEGLCSYCDKLFYLNASGVSTELKSGDYKPVTDSNVDVTWSSGWYVVTKDTTINATVTLEKSAAVNLLLCDGATLTVNGGITCSDGTSAATHTLTIYVQSGGTGALVAKGKAGENQYYSGGINCAYGNLVVYGGNVTGEGYAEATLSEGISAGSLEVHGGTVTGTGKSKGIDASLTLTGGTLKGVGDIAFAHGSYTISGGTFIAEGKTYGLNDAYDWNVFKITGGTFTVSSSEDGFVKLLAENGYAFFEDGKLVNAATATSLNNAKVLPHTCSFTTPESFDANYFCECGRKSVWYQAYDETSGKFEKKPREDYHLLKDSDADVDVQDNGWIIAPPGTTTINGSLTLRGSTGTNLILCDGATLIVKGGIYSFRDLNIYGQEKGTGKLIVRDGTYNKNSETYGYGICLYDAYVSDLTLTVHGGTVTATGGAASGGTYGNLSVGIQVDQVKVTGGTVNAIGGSAKGDGVNISYGMNSALTLTGGTVNVSADAETTYTPYFGRATVSGGTLKLPRNSVLSPGSKVTAPVTFADLLASGCAYQQYGETEPAKLADLTNPLTKSVTVVPHEEHDYGEDGKCVYCGASKPSDSSYSIKVLAAENGAVKASAKKSGKGKTIILTITPDEGYELDEILVQDAKGNELELTEAGEGKFTFVMPRSAVTVEATFVSSEVTPEPEPEPDSPSFSDVPSDSWFAPAVSWAVKNGITTGTSATTFAPDLSCTRAELVTFLWRAAGSPEPNGAAPFDDVPANAYYTAAVAWGFENDLVKGCGNNLFRPDNVISRQETATILYRYAQSQGLGFTGAWAFRLPFDDLADLSDWALEGVSWCYKEGVLEGFGNKLAPKADCSRAQIVTMLYRLLAE